LAQAFSRLFWDLRRRDASDIELILPDGQISLLLRVTLSTRHSGALAKRASPESITREGRNLGGAAMRGQKTLAGGYGFRARASRVPE